MNMRHGLLIGRLFGTDIYCEPTFFLLIGLYFWMAGAAAGALFSAAVLVSILVHEFGHVLAVKRLLGTPSIVVLWGLGGLCIYRGSPRPGQQAVISLLGPVMSFTLGAASFLAYVLLPEAPLLDRFLTIMIWINLVWALVNLLPAVPLDGGQAVRAALRAGLGRSKGDRVMRIVSLATAAAATAAAAIVGYPMAAFLGVLILLENIKRPPVAYD
jgi:Zn-dependent protease